MSGCVCANILCAQYGCMKDIRYRPTSQPPLWACPAPNTAPPARNDSKEYVLAVSALRNIVAAFGTERARNCPMTAAAHEALQDARALLDRLDGVKR